MTFASSAPTRQRLPGLAEHEVPETSVGSQTPDTSESSLARLRLLWMHRKMLWRVAICGVLGSALIAFLIPARYESTARLMPPDNKSSAGLALAAAAMSGTAGAGGLGGIAGDLLGLKSTSDLFVGILTSRTVQDKLIEQFNLKKLYRARNMEDARKELTANTTLSVDRKSQITSVTVTDRNPQRAAAMSQAY